MNLAGRTIGYFTVWGTLYGGIVGLLSGASAWIIGAALGALYGSIMGCVLGVIIGIVTVIIHKLTFHQDIDLARYRRRLAVFNGLSAVIIGVCALTWLIVTYLRQPPYRAEIDNFYPLFVAFIIKTTILTTLCIAYISSHYPDWIVHTFYSPDPLPRSYSVLKAFINLGKSFLEPERVMLVIAPLMLLYIGEVMSAFQMKVSIYNAFSILIMGFLGSVGTFPFFCVLRHVGKRRFADVYKAAFCG